MLAVPRMLFLSGSSQSLVVLQPPAASEHGTAAAALTTACFHFGLCHLLGPISVLWGGDVRAR